MSGRDDYSDDMRQSPLDDASTEALLRGEPSAADPQLAGVSAFLGEMRAYATRPAPAPSTALAALLRDGYGPAPVPVGTGKRVGPAMAGWRRRLTVSTLGLSVGLTGIVGAGAAGLLPGPAERVIAGLVETLTPLQLPKSALGRTVGPADRQRGPAAGAGGAGSTGAEGGPGGLETGSGAATGPGSPRQPGTTTGKGSNSAGGGAGTPGPTAPGATGPAPGISAPGITSPPPPPLGSVPPAPTAPIIPPTPTVPPGTVPTPPAVTTTTLPVTPPGRPGPTLTVPLPPHA